VWIRPVDTDRYGRTVAEVIGEINVGLAMVEDGWAFVHPRHVEACAAEEYRQAEFRASRHRYGLWQEPGGIERPWVFRREQRR
jgi:endonuclease YncB( thermonuclease family)